MPFVATPDSSSFQPSELTQESLMPADTVRQPSEVTRLLMRAEAGATPRKSRLFACGCARLAWNLLDAPAARRAVVTAEEYADGGVTAGEFRTAAAGARLVRKSSPRSDSDDKRRYRALTAVYHAAYTGQKGGSPFAYAVAALEALPADVRDAGGPGLVGCVFGAPPSCPPAPYAWQTPEVTVLAAEVYAGRAWDRLPELAESLAAAGCYWSPLLDHLRDGGPHTRGCWALDFMLGRA
jgi:hypothetical protein